MSPDKETKEEGKEYGLDWTAENNVVAVFSTRKKGLLGDSPALTFDNIREATREIGKTHGILQIVPILSPTAANFLDGALVIVGPKPSTQ